MLLKGAYRLFLWIHHKPTALKDIFYQIWNGTKPFHPPFILSLVIANKSHTFNGTMCTDILTHSPMLVKNYSLIFVNTDLILGIFFYYRYEWRESRGLLKKYEEIPRCQAYYFDIKWVLQSLGILPLRCLRYWYVQRPTSARLKFGVFCIMHVTCWRRAKCSWSNEARPGEGIHIAGRTPPGFVRGPLG